MAFLSLPNEIIFEIVEKLDNEQDIYSLVRVNKRIHNLLHDYLYCYDITHRKGRALFWAAEHGRESTARKLLHQGADVNVTTQQARSNGTWQRAGLTPLHLAAGKGHLVVVKLLLEVGADPEARDQKRLTPLFFAIVARHEKVARTISRRIRNLQNCLVDLTKRLTPLHVSCREGLSNCTRYFLNEGADVDAIDASAMTPLHHVLLTNIGEGESSPTPEEIFKTAKVLVEFRANQNLETRLRGEKHVTARECGVNHPYDRVRALFSNGVDGPLYNSSKHKPRTLRIGRTWMPLSLTGMNGTERDGPSPVDHINAERFFNSFRGGRTSYRDQDQLDILNLTSFPILESANQKHLSSLRTHVSDDPWSPSNIDGLIKGFSIVKEPDIPPVAERNAQLNPFPQLNTHIPKNPMETGAGRLWADFGKPTGRPVAEQLSSKSARNEKDSFPEMKSIKAHGKNRWQPLKFQGL